MDKLLALAYRAKQGGVILNYHTLSAEQTRQQIELWGRHFDFIHHDELGQRIETPGRKPFCLITFDDGKRSNLIETAPVLASLGVPAVFYIVTRFTSGELPVLWFDAWREFLKQRGKPPQGLASRELKRLPHSERIERLEAAYREHGFRPSLGGEDTAALSWDEVRQLHQQGHAIGAHSETHPILTTLPLAEAQSEIRRSVSRVSEELGAPCASFAFPNGNYTEDLARYALRCGTQTVMTTDPTWVGRATPPWSLPRVQLDGSQTLPWAKLKVFVAALGCLLGNPDGTGRQYVRTRKRTPKQATRLGWRSNDAGPPAQPPRPGDRAAIGSSGD